MLAIEACTTSKESLGMLHRQLVDVAGDGLDGLSDELGAYLHLQDQTQLSSLSKTQQEFAVYQRSQGALHGLASMTTNEFIRILCDIHGRLGVGLRGFRNGPVAIRRDRAGNSILYPEARHCSRLVSALHAFLSSRIMVEPALCAITAYGALIHAHPFSDGNGRTARTVYNLILAEFGGSTHFLPVHMVASLDQASFIIKLRRAVYFGYWQGLVEFFAAATRVSDRAQRTS